MDPQSGDSIGDRFKSILGQIDRATLASGRPKGAVRLVAATKTVSIERIREAIAAGLTLAGENRLQEALPKIEALRGEPIRWHFIGRLQRRKVRAVIGVFDLIHSVDSLELAQEINQRAGNAGLRQAILLEVNVGGEETKAGFLIEEVEQVLTQMGALPYVAVQGLMAIPPQVKDADQARPYFRQMRELAVKLSQAGISGVSMDELSMGMSNDYPVAIEEGATLVRIGTALFGTRHA